MEKVNITIGRFQPFTTGHMKCIEGPYKDKGLRTVVCMINTKDNKVDSRHPFPSSKMLPLYKKAFKSNKMVADFVLVVSADPVKISQLLKPMGYEISSWSCGTDRIDAYSAMAERYHEYKGEQILADDFEMYEVKRGDEDVSATKVRQALRDNDKKSYESMVPKDLWKDFDDLRDIVLSVNEGLIIDEDECPDENYLITEATKPSKLRKISTTKESSSNRWRGPYNKVEKFFDLDKDENCVYSRFQDLYRGFITDKKGNEYDVCVTLKHTSVYLDPHGNSHGVVDGPSRLTVEIYGLHDDKDDATFIADFKYYGKDTDHKDMAILSDLEKGIYLEDYFSKHLDDLSPDCAGKFDDIANGGDSSAVSFYDKARQQEKIAKDKFWSTKICVRPEFAWSVKNGVVEINMSSTSGDSDLTIPNRVAGEYFEKYLLSEFDINNVSDLNGLFGMGVLKVGNNLGTLYSGRLYVDTKSNKLALIDPAKMKIEKELGVGFRGTQISANPKYASQYVATWFELAFSAWKKTQKKTDYVQSHYRELMYSKNYYNYTKLMSANDAREMAGRDWEDMIKKSEWDGQKVIVMNIQILKDVMDKVPKSKIDTVPVEEKPVETPVKEKPAVSVTPVSNSNSSAPAGIPAGIKISTEAKMKMQAWHTGIRGFNVKSAGEAKLKMNYWACVSMGYDKEANIIKQEADSRGIVLESLRRSVKVTSLFDYIKRISE